MSKYSSKIFLSLLWLVGIIAIIAFIFNTIELFQYGIMLNSEGLLNFFKIYDAFIKVMTAFLALLAAQLTLNRIHQTDEHLKKLDKNLLLTEENIKFNNYYKHYEEFRKFAKELSLFMLVKEISGLSVDVQSIAVYNHYFNKNYYDFSPTLNKNAKEEIQKYITALYESPLNAEDVDLETIDIELIKNIHSQINPILLELCKVIYRKELPDVRKYIFSHGGKAIKLVEERFELLSDLYWSSSFLEGVLAFDGTVKSFIENYSKNFGDYRDSIGLVQL